MARFLVATRLAITQILPGDFNTELLWLITRRDASRKPATPTPHTNYAGNVALVEKNGVQTWGGLLGDELVAFNDEFERGVSLRRILGRMDQAADADNFAANTRAT